MNVVFPRNMAALFKALDEPGARVLAGGTDLLVRLRSHPDSGPATLVGLDRLPALRGVAEDSGWEPGLGTKDGRGDGSPSESVGPGTLHRALRLGAATTHAELLAHPLIRARLPVLAQALADLGSPPIRNMGTLGGNICTASPAGDTLPPLLALGAEVELAAKTGTRRLPLASFLLGPGRTALKPGEVLAAVCVPVPGVDVRQHFEKVGRRDALAVAVVSLAALVRTGHGGKIVEAHLAWGSVGPTVWRCPEVEAALAGRKLSLTALTEAASIVRSQVQPIDDVRASADYRREVAGNLLLRLAMLE
ncbi:MAG: xanthine dehydrogenase family protein subunit M [Proteobacteria bacterium]|nr:xanthine dehydrogenase family protein subunit M [Pseudomonadota bacterium]